MEPIQGVAAERIGNMPCIVEGQAQRGSTIPAPSLPGTRQQAQAATVTPEQLSNAAANVTMSSGRNLVADYVLGADSRLAGIRVIDPATHQVIAESPPDSIARMQQEVLAYQRLARENGAS